MATIVITKDNPRPSEDEMRRIEEEQKRDTIKLYSVYVRKLKGKKDEKSRLEREIYQAIVDQEKGKIPYSKLDAIRERNNKILEPYYEAERIEESKRRHEKVLREGKRQRLMLAKDPKLRFFKEFDGIDPKDKGFKEGVEEAKKQKFMGMIISNDHVAGLIENEGEFLKTRRIVNEETLKINSPEAKKLLNENSAVQFDGEAFPTEYIERALKSLNRGDPITFKSAAGLKEGGEIAKGRVLMMADQSGNQIVIAPKIVSSDIESHAEDIAKLTPLSRLGEKTTAMPIAHRVVKHRKERRPKISIHRTTKHKKPHSKKLSRKAKKVGQHGAIRDTCIYCEREHSTDRHRFHGKNSYLRTHRRSSNRKGEERIL